ncbi:nucleotide-binding universal stress UspA family protein [Kitasatospora sp. MAP12-15]|uniref:universal stress protein n=1 Tax=unclassified Kitasatospora TaxID=2633591 RepID=UPI0024756CB8|nr:universal stress protein [Kitasatospora sp. MAP12-44]MDH6108558.1 nucleotide-binding universal stress UspA family protein [Kitasatospora sp. MAP12-44]
MAEDTTRVVVGVSGSKGSAAVLRSALEEAARRDAVLVPVLAWTPVGGEPAYRAHPCPPLAKIWAQAATDRLDAVLTEALGGRPAGVRIEPIVVRGEAGHVLAGVADGPDDLLMVGAGRRGLARVLHGSVSRYVLAHASCPVVAVPPTDQLPAARPVAHREERPTLVAA